MPDIDPRKLKALARKNAAKAESERAKRSRKYDDTLRKENVDDEETQRFFDEMKKREF